MAGARRERRRIMESSVATAAVATGARLCPLIRDTSQRVLFPARVAYYAKAIQALDPDRAHPARTIAPVASAAKLRRMTVAPCVGDRERKRLCWYFARQSLELKGLNDGSVGQIGGGELRLISTESRL